MTSLTDVSVVGLLSGDNRSLQLFVFMSSDKIYGLFETTIYAKVLDFVIPVYFPKIQSRHVFNLVVSQNSLSDVTWSFIRIQWHFTYWNEDFNQNFQNIEICNFIFLATGQRVIAYSYRFEFSENYRPSSFKILMTCLVETFCVLFKYMRLW